MTCGHCILSHGFNSNPNARKIKLLGAVAEQLGWSCEYPDYTAYDTQLQISAVGDVLGRQKYLDTCVQHARMGDDKPLVLVGSSLGGYISARESLTSCVHGLFLMVPPVYLGHFSALDAAPIPTWVVHGWRDTIVPAQDVITWARTRLTKLIMLDDDHFLHQHLSLLHAVFADMLGAIASQYRVPPLTPP